MPAMPACRVPKTAKTNPPQSHPPQSASSEEIATPHRAPFFPPEPASIVFLQPHRTSRSTKRDGRPTTGGAKYHSRRHSCHGAKADPRSRPSDLHCYPRLAAGSGLGRGGRISEVACCTCRPAGTQAHSRPVCCCWGIFSGSLTAFFQAGWAAVAGKKKCDCSFLLSRCGDEDWVGLLVDNRCKLSVINTAPNLSFLGFFLVGHELEEMTGNCFWRKL